MYPKYPLLRTIRALLKCPWAVLENGPCPRGTDAPKPSTPKPLNPKPLNPCPRGTDAHEWGHVQPSPVLRRHRKLFQHEAKGFRVWCCYGSCYDYHKLSLLLLATILLFFFFVIISDTGSMIMKGWGMWRTSSILSLTGLQCQVPISSKKGGKNEIWEFPKIGDPKTVP